MTQQKYLTEAAVARALDKCPAALCKALKRSGIVPDLIAGGRIKLYSPETFQQIRALLTTPAPVAVAETAQVLANN